MKTLGLIGGLTWLSSVEYYRAINEQLNARLGGRHSAKIIPYSLDFAEFQPPSPRAASSASSLAARRA
jgi:aspartate racemase